ncbi:helix-turn-helix transcriptional regulator [Actinokineospora sp. PR83]|uniref:helix-turn-helix domain-containing protein n=1 Tax=Actinokineospora sp. PR83 TaxID=2884908 RepID=UPI0027E18568|nr:helix-turn-helix transcriptional regulator [Actinokineospora sp. PR83]MCG8917578.1 helix-turn-helix transcriptional regulator [Actinokineospora sp. PR83]
MARTPKARALGAALRQARQDKGLLLRELASAIKRDIGVLSRWETGERIPKPEQVAQILTRLDVGGDRYDEIMTLVYGTDESQWVAMTLPERRQQMAAYVHWEQNASRIVAVAPLLVPGLLQTSEYTRAIMTAAGVPTGEIASRVTSRIGRREAITRSASPAELVVLLGQGALNQDIGGVRTTIGQLDHLLDMATRPNVELRIVLDRSGWHPGLDGAFELIESSAAMPMRNKGGRHGAVELDSIVFVGARRSVLILHEEDDVNAYKRAVDSIHRVSQSPDASTNIIAEVRNRLEKQGV